MIKFKNYRKLRCQVTVPQILEDWSVKQVLKRHSHIVEITIFGVQTFQFHSKEGFKEFIKSYNQEHDHILFMKEYGHQFKSKCKYPLDEIVIDPNASYSYK